MKQFSILLLFFLSATHLQATNSNVQNTFEKNNKKVFEINKPDYTQSPYTGMTRQHWVDAANYLLEGAFSYIENFDSPMKFPKQHEKTYPHDEKQVAVEKLEGLCRTLFIAAPLLKENPGLELNGIKVADYYRYQILNLVDPDNSAYIKPRGDGGPSQTLVELGALAISLSIAPEILWQPLTQSQKDSIAKMMLSYGDGPTVSSNWRFFNIFILSFFKDKGYKVNEDLLVKYVTECLAAYRGQGWYNDSPAYDYYSMWAFQLYGPLWAQLYGDKYYPGYAGCFMANLNEIPDNYPYMFNREGQMNMWGRSISYRFGAVAPFAMLGFVENSKVNYGWLRYISSATLLQFLQHPDFLEDNVPTLGFYGPFEPAVQIYSCRGSVYWGGKVFFALLLPEDNPFWNTKENNGPWENDFEHDHVYNKFQKRSNLLITNYPNSGASEIRSWCHESVANDWQKFRSTENYNKLAYNTEFPWMADGKEGEIAMNYGVLNNKNEWEVLRLYTFRSFEDGVYRRDAFLETNNEIQFKLADIPLPNGILRIDKVITPVDIDIRLGHYSLPELGSPIIEQIEKAENNTAHIINNGAYKLSMIPLQGWSAQTTLYASGLHPVSKKCAVIIATDKLPAGERIYITLQLWKKGKDEFSTKELSPIKDIKIKHEGKLVEISLKDGNKKSIRF